MPVHRIDGLGYFLNGVGEGPPLLLLHGFTGSHASWTPFLPAFAANWTCLAVDLPGHGMSDVPARLSRFGHQSVSADLVALMEQFGHRRFHLLGYSMGGRLALTLALKYPHRVSALVLESASPGLASLEQREERRARDEALAGRIEAEGLCRFVRYWESLPLFASQRGLPAERRNRLRRQRLQHSAAGLAGSLRGAGTGSQPSLWQQLATMSVPTLLLTGALDSRFCAIAQAMKGANPGFATLQVEGAGHCIHLEQPQQFQREVTGFLRKQEGDHAGC